MRSFSSFNDAFVGLVDEVWNYHTYVSCPRGQTVKERLAVQFSITDPRKRLLTVPERDASLCYVIAESLWYLLGSDKTEWIANYSAFWKNISDDGVTANSAYGSRIFKRHPKVAGGRLTQWDYVKEELKKDPDSRRAVVLIRTPDDSIDAQLDVPCTLSLQFFIRGGKLHLVSTMRSSDLILGITNDIPAFCLFQELLARDLGVELGTYTHTSNSLHVYERHFPMCETIASRKRGVPYSVALPPLPPGEIPVAQMDRVQEVARSITTPAGLEQFYNTGLHFIMDGQDPYWCDWAKILVAHRAGKLGEPQMMADMIAGTEFTGYHAFKK